MPHFPLPPIPSRNYAIHLIGPRIDAQLQSGLLARSLERGIRSE